MTTKREQIEKDYIAECEAAGKACAARLLKAIDNRRKALFALSDEQLPKLATGKKKRANPKARP